MLQYIYCRPMWILTIGVVVYLLGYANLNVFLKKRIWHIIFNIIAFLISILIILYMTVFRSESGNNQVELRPFYTFVMAQSQVEYYRTYKN